MGIGLFKQTYTIRRYAPQAIIDGYATAQFTDMPANLNVQPLSPDEMMALPEGARTVKRIKSFGPGRLSPSDEYAGTPGDRLHYCGHWYECTSSVMWGHTMLSHYRSEFVILKEQESPPQGVEGT